MTKVFYTSVRIGHEVFEGFTPRESYKAALFEVAYTLLHRAIGDNDELMVSLYSILYLTEEEALKFFIQRMEEHVLPWASHKITEEVRPAPKRSRDDPCPRLGQFVFGLPQPGDSKRLNKS